MTTASAGSSVATAASTTATTSSKAGNPAGSATATSEATKPQLTGRAAIAASIEEMRTDAGDDADDTSSEGNQPAPKDAEKKEADAAEPEGDKSKVDKGKDQANEKPVSKKAFKERLDRERERFDKVQGQLQTKDLELKKSNEVLKLALTQIARLEEALKTGAKYDENAEKLTERETALAAKEAIGKVTTEHEQLAETARRDAEIAVHAEQLGEEVAEALGAHDLVHRGELIDAMKKDSKLARQENRAPKGAEEVAAELETAKLEKARAKLVPAKPAHPESARAQRSGGSNAAVNYGHDKKGIAEHIEALRTQKG